MTFVQIDSFVSDIFSRGKRFDGVSSTTSFMNQVKQGHIYLFFALVWRFDCIKTSSACLISFSPSLYDITQTCLGLALALHLIFGFFFFLYLFVPGIVRAHSDTLWSADQQRNTFALWEGLFIRSCDSKWIQQDDPDCLHDYVMGNEVPSLSGRCCLDTCKKHSNLHNQFLQHVN